MMDIGLTVAPLLAAVIVLVYLIIFGRKREGLVGRLSTRLWDSTVVAAGYSIPLLYAAIMAGCLYLFHFYCRDLLQSPLHRKFVVLNYPIPFLVVLWGTFSNPGRITRANHERALAMFPYDRVLYMPFNECRTCEFAKPARSKHCGVCGTCVALQDHHCVFINNCVGVGNFKAFSAFLLGTLYIMVYGFIALTSILWNHFAFFSKGRLQWPVLVEADRQQFRVVLCLCLAAVLVSLLDVVFYGYIIYFVYAGSTTNEATKWEDIQELMEDGVLYIYKLPETVDQCILLQKTENGAWHRSLNSQEAELVAKYKAELVKVESFEDLKNIYDKGFCNNLMLLLDPPSLT